MIMAVVSQQGRSPYAINIAMQKCCSDIQKTKKGGRDMEKKK